jgi:hypothetical protein
MRIRRLRLAGTILAAALFPIAALAHNPLGPTPHTPDLLGIYVGMPMQAAEDQLQKHSSEVYVMTNELPDDLNLTISNPETADITKAYLTQSPNDPPTVWMVTRDWSQSGGPGMTESVLLSALHAKYGHETMHKIQGDTRLYWIFDSNGHLLSHADPALMGCSGLDFVSKMHSPIGYGACDVMDTCAKHFFAITASYNAPPPNNPLIGNYHVVLVNLPYAVKACHVSADAMNAAANRARQEQLEKANANRPSF